MKKNIQDDLFDLIHSLDPAERGYFSKYAQRHVLGEGNNYEALYQLILQMSSYDPLALEATLKLKGIHTPLAVAKSHLKSIIFRAMREYNSNRSTYKSLLDGLGNLSFLYEKKLYGLLRKELKRLKKIAESYEEHHVLFKVGEFERRLHKETARKGFIEGMAGILSEMKAVALNFQNQLEFTHLMDQAFVIANKAGADREQELASLLDSPILQDAVRATTTFSKIYLHQVFAIAHTIRLQYPEALQQYAEVLRFWDAAPHLIEEFPSIYRRVMGNFMGISGYLRDFSRHAELIAKVRASPGSQPVDAAERFNISYTAELVWHLGTHQWKEAKTIIPAIQKGLETYETILSLATVLTFRHNCINFFLLDENYAACRSWLRDITEIPATEQRMDIQRLARALSLLLIWKSGDISHLEYSERSAARYFETVGGGLVENAILKLVRNLIHAVNHVESQTHLLEFADSLAQPDLKELLGAIPIRAWAMGQVDGSDPKAILENF